MRYGLVFGLGVVLFAAGIALAGQAELDRALELRNATGALWNEGKHAEAAEKLRAADAIYVAESGELLAERAVTLRALCWNEFKAGQVDEARATFGRLAKLASGHDDQWKEVWSAYVAVKDAARTLPDLDAETAYMTELRALAKKLRYPKIAAQAWHDLAYGASERGDEAAAIPLLEVAIAERRKLSDPSALTWSLNNLANSLVLLGRLDDAFDPIEEAWDLVHEDGQTGPQFSVETRISDVLTGLEALEETSKAQRKWVGEMTTKIARNSRPMRVHADRMLRASIALDPSSKNLIRVMRTLPKTEVGEVQLDIYLRCVQAMVAADDLAKARRTAGGLEAISGPVAPHLTARTQTVAAVLLARAEKREEFAEKAHTAASAWRELGDRAGREAALEQIVAEINTLGLSSEMADLVDEYTELRSKGRPGGAGGSASTMGDRSGADALGDHDPVFRITAVDGGIRIHDVVADKEMIGEIEWKPRAKSLNGGAFRLFGGYVVVLSMSYGGSAAAPASRGTTTLDELGLYLPVPAQGSLVVTKNGATYYDMK